ncbi:ester cyclase [Nocardia alba]|uniref:Activator of Hsp90 ATPase-like protein n=1 Tax=Nocardia alba TaxID=225051 RepID=A0A4R1F6I4_9NOCA|nr:ester cyclase [Nocardia alba]TCJ89897.1 activator of Hsp90 ATPase-like protein [Nocardia alba]
MTAPKSHTESPYGTAPENTEEWAVRKQVWVPAGPNAAFEVFVSHPTEWCPDHDVLVAPRDRIVFEPRVGGRWYEISTSGEMRDLGRILHFEPGHSLSLTWRVDGRWQPVDDDEIASRIVVTFTPGDAGGTDVEFTHLELWRHGPDAEVIRNAVGGDSPGETLALFERAVRRRYPAVADPTTAPDVGTTAANKRVVLASFDALASGELDLPLAAQMHTPEYIDHQARPGSARGPAMVVAHARWLRSVYPDLAFEIEDIIAEDDKVVLRCVFTGTHLGDLFGIAPTGKLVRTDQIHILRLDGGRIAEHWAGRDHSKLAEQLGV